MPVTHSIVQSKASLHQLAEDINRKHGAVKQRDLRNLETAKEIGDLLRAAKEQCVRQGEAWNAWQEEHLQLSRNRACQYMRISKHWEDVQSAGSIRKAIAMIEEINTPINPPESSSRNARCDTSPEGSKCPAPGVTPPEGSKCPAPPEKKPGVSLKEFQKRLHDLLFDDNLPLDKRKAIAIRVYRKWAKEQHGEG